MIPIDLRDGTKEVKKFIQKLIQLKNIIYLVDVYFLHHFCLLELCKTLRKNENLQMNKNSKLLYQDGYIKILLKMNVKNYSSLNH